MSVRTKRQIVFLVTSITGYHEDGTLITALRNGLARSMFSSAEPQEARNRFCCSVLSSRAFDGRSSMGFPGRPFFRTGSAASSGMIHCLPTNWAPGMRPSRQKVRILSCERPKRFENSVTDIMKPVYKKLFRLRNGYGSTRRFSGGTWREVTSVGPMMTASNGHSFATQVFGFRLQ